MTDITLHQSAEALAAILGAERSLRDDLDEKITAQLVKDMGPDTTLDGPWLVSAQRGVPNINVDDLVNAVLSVIREHAS